MKLLKIYDFVKVERYTSMTPEITEIHRDVSANVLIQSTIIFEMGDFKDFEFGFSSIMFTIREAIRETMAYGTHS